MNRSSAPRPITIDAGGPRGASMTEAKQGVDCRLGFIEHLLSAGVALFTAAPGGRIDAVPNGEGELVEVLLRQPSDPEFVRPMGWTLLSAEDNNERLSEFRYYMALCVLCGPVLAVVDVDPRNGGDIEMVRALLGRLKVRIFAEVITPGGGRHFYVAGHADLPSTSWKKRELADFPGVDIQSHGRNVFTVPTMRPKYPGKDYTIVFDDLAALATEGDPEGSEALVAWVVQQRYRGVEKKARKRGGSGVFDFEVCPPWTGGVPDARQQAYLDKVLEASAKKVAASEPGGRNDTLYRAALKCGSYIAGAGMDRDTVIKALQAAAEECGLTEEEGVASAKATVKSAFRIAFTNPRAVPDRENSTVVRTFRAGKVGREARAAHVAHITGLRKP